MITLWDSFDFPLAGATGAAFLFDFTEIPVFAAFAGAGFLVALPILERDGLGFGVFLFFEDGAEGFGGFTDVLVAVVLRADLPSAFLAAGFSRVRDTTDFADMVLRIDVTGFFAAACAAGAFPVFTLAVFAALVFAAFLLTVMSQRLQFYGSVRSVFKAAYASIVHQIESTTL